jgi:hypothetical protein
MRGRLGVSRLEWVTPYPLSFCLLCHIKHCRACLHPLTPAAVLWLCPRWCLTAVSAVACALALPVPMLLGRWRTYISTWALISELNVLFWLVN